MTQGVINEPFIDYDATIARCLSAAGIGDLLAGGRSILLKPNLVNDSPHPVTTSPAFCAAAITALRCYTDAPVVIAEGCGDAGLDTMTVFGRLGYAAIFDLNRYRRPDFSILDASVGLADFHLGGPTCDPPVNRILAGVDARAVDRVAAGLLDIDWRKVGHLA